MMPARDVMPNLLPPPNLPSLPLPLRRRRPTRALVALALLAAPLGGACGGLKLQLVDASVRKPSNVAVYFTVDTTGGEPVANLQPTDFHIYEDGKPFSTLVIQQT